MGKFNPAADLDKYSTQGSYFSLADDGDTAMVRFMYESIEDIEGYVVHRIDVGGYTKNVSCLRSYADPLDACPLCAARHKTFVKFFVPLYMEDTGEVKIWERGQNFYSHLAELCSEYVPLVSYPIEIERKGAKGDMKTKYETYVQKSDQTNLDDLPEIPSLENVVLEKTFDELTTYVNTGSFESGDANPVNAQNNVNVRRRRDVSANSAVRRRTSANNNDDCPL